ncbi:MAG: DUF6035 family protein [Flavobacterium sp.]
MERPSKTTRTIEEVLNLETGAIIYADLFFSMEPYDVIIKMRSELQKAIEGLREPLLTCFYCKQKVRIRGRNRFSSEEESKTETFHFAHLKDSEECHIKTKNQLTKEEVDRIKYNGIKESALHRNLKEKIAELLSKNINQGGGVAKIEVEKVVQGKVDKEWKKPDINLFFHEKRIAIELQLSTTWLNVITRRQHFYRENSIYIFWIFNNFDIENETRKLTFDDVIYTNNQNAYVFDMEAAEKSEIENDLVLKCYYKRFQIIGNSINESWHKSFIKLSDLNFDQDNFRVFYFDSEGEKRKLSLELQQEKKQKKQQEEKKKWEIEEQEKHEKLQEQEEINRNRIYWEAKNYKEISLLKELHELSQPMSGLINQSNKLTSKLNSLSLFLDNINDNSKKVLNYFSGTLSSQKPFYENDELLHNLKEKYECSIKEIKSLLDKRVVELDYAQKCLNAINGKEVLEISAKKYSILNVNSDLNFIKRYLSEILIINKNSVSGLFASEELRSILNEVELNRIQFSNDIYFLFDFTNRLIEFSQKQHILKIQIEEIHLNLNKISDLIKNEMVTNIENRIQVIKDEIEKNNETKRDLEIRISNKQSEIENSNF